MTTSDTASASAQGTFLDAPWKRAGDELLWWTWDQMHHPRPARPYTASIECEAMGRGCSTGFQTLGLPLTMRLTELDGYVYTAVELFDLDANRWLPGVQANVVGALNGLLERWRSEYLPRVLELNARLRDFDYAGANVDALIALIDESVAIREEQWDIHMRVVAPVMFAAGELANQWESAFGAERRPEAALLLQGFPNKTIEAGAALWRLSREALKDAGVAGIITGTPVRRVVPLLRTTDAGRAFVERLDAYLREYGWRAGGFEYADAPWIDDPATVMTTVREYLQQPEEMDPALLAERSRREREELEARVLPEVDALPAGRSSTCRSRRTTTSTSIR
jgi:pyruvate,water dikinase